MVLESFTLVLWLPKTRKKTDVRRSILNYVKSFISDIDIIRDLHVTMSKRDIEIIDEKFTFYFDSANVFKMGFMTEEENAIESINIVMNEIFKKLNEMNREKAKSQISLFHSLEYATKNDLFSKLINKEPLEELSPAGMKFVPTNVQVSNKGKERQRFLITARKEDILLDVQIFREYEDRFPDDITLKAIKDSKELLSRILTTLVGDEQ